MLDVAELPECGGWIQFASKVFNKYLKTLVFQFLEHSLKTLRPGVRSFLDAAELPEERRPGPLVDLRDAAAFAAYNAYTAVEPLRKLAGANADTGYNPEYVTDVDHVARVAKKDAARRQTSSGWYRNVQGSVSFRCVGALRV